jgi:WhiB family redox-sensing transcriptional regulator
VLAPVQKEDLGWQHRSFAEPKSCTAWYVNGFTTHDALPRRGFVTLTWTRTHDWDADDWRDRASCRSIDPDLFFPVGTTGSALVQIETAKAVCEACDAQPACLEFALATNQESGVWGGTSEEERRKLRKQWVARQRRTA